MKQIAALTAMTVGSCSFPASRGALSLAPLSLTRERRALPESQLCGVFGVRAPAIHPRLPPGRLRLPTSGKSGVKEIMAADDDAELDRVAAGGEQPRPQTLLIGLRMNISRSSAEIIFASFIGPLLLGWPQRHALTCPLMSTNGSSTLRTSVMRWLSMRPRYDVIGSTINRRKSPSAFERMLESCTSLARSSPRRLPASRTCGMISPGRPEDRRRRRAAAA